MSISPTIDRRDINIATDDGYVLSATLFSDPSSNGNGPVTVIASATGVPQSYYARFASFLASQGHHALTFDCRGIGRSAPASLRGFPVRFRDWAIKDFPAVIDWADASYPGRLLHWVGHSYGGFGLGLARNNARVDKLLGVATMSADVSLIENKLAGWQIGLMLFGVGPIVARVWGFVPGFLFGGTDLPKHVVLEWSRWCRTRDFLFGVSDLPEKRFFETLVAGVRLARMTDDTWVDVRGVEHLLAHFVTSGQRDIWTIDPKMVGGRAIGHLGFFRSEFRDTLWRDAIAWLDGTKQIVE